MAKKCKDCNAVYSQPLPMCQKCGCVDFVDFDEESEARVEDAAKKQEEEAQAFLEKSKNLFCSTVESPEGIELSETMGLVFGNSSVQAFWGLSTQANRLSRAYEAALLNLKFNAAHLGADAVVGIRFALNNSEGSKAFDIGLAGSSEAVMLLGTAVVLKK